MVKCGQVCSTAEEQGCPEESQLGVWGRPHRGAISVCAEDRGWRDELPEHGRGPFLRRPQPGLARTSLRSRAVPAQKPRQDGERASKAASSLGPVSLPFLGPELSSLFLGECPSCLSRRDTGLNSHPKEMCALEKIVRTEAQSPWHESSGALVSARP